MSSINPLWFIFAASLLFLLVVGVTVAKMLRKAEPGTALVKTGFGLKDAAVSLSSMLAIPVLHLVEKIDLTLKTVTIERKGVDSLSCLDGIRAEVIVDFYIMINPEVSSIRKVASSIGCRNAGDIQKIRELFEAKFSDALKTAGSKLAFDALYTDRKKFSDEILQALGGDEGDALVLNGYRLDDVAIQYLEQLPFEDHNEHNVLDAKGRKVIAERTAEEAEFANERLKKKEVTIATQNRNAQVEQYNIDKELAAQESEKDTKVAEAKERARSSAEKATVLANREIEEAKIQKDLSIKKAQIAANVQETQAHQDELAAEEKEAKQAAVTEAAKEKAHTARDLEIASRSKQVAVIQAEKDKELQLVKDKVEVDAQAYRISQIAAASKEAASLDAESAELKAKAIKLVAAAEAEKVTLLNAAENELDEKIINKEIVLTLINSLPSIIEQAMKPVEKIDSIKIIQAPGMGGNGAGEGNGSPMGGVLSGIVGAGIALPVFKEFMNILKTSGGEDLTNQLLDLPGLGPILKQLEDSKPVTVDEFHNDRDDLDE